MGFVAFFVARFFEISAFYLVSSGIDEIGELLTRSADAASNVSDVVSQSHTLMTLAGRQISLVTGVILNDVSGYSLAEITAGIVVCVLMRFVFVMYARRSVRRAGIGVSFDLRQKLYRSVQK